MCLQLLKGMSTQRRKNIGRTAEEEESQSGDCDDEDECEDGSGKSALRIRNQLRLIPGKTIISLIAELIECALREELEQIYKSIA